MRLMFMDECKSRDTGIVSLTALIVDEHEYASLRQALFGSLGQFVRPRPDNYGIPPEIHGSDFLREVENDEVRFEVVRGVFEAVANTDSRIYRCGYYYDENLPEGLGSDHGLLGLAYLGIQFMTQPEFEDQILVPIMDGVDIQIAEQFGAANHHANALIANGFGEENITIQNIANLAESTVADSRYSITTQCVDLMSYCYHCRDWVNQGFPASEYKQKLAELTQVLDPRLSRHEIVRMNMLGAENGESE